MNQEISYLLDQIDKQRELCEPPANIEDISAVTNYLRTEFDLTLPPIWSGLWLRSDGVTENGLNIYRAGPARRVHKGFIDSFIAVNETYKDVSDGNYVFYGHADDVAAYVYHIPSGTWQDVDPIGHDAFETYATPEELIATILKKYLEM